MTKLPQTLNTLTYASYYNTSNINREIAKRITSAGYEIVESTEESNPKPWGAYLRLNSEQADSFVKDFFDDLTSKEARLGNPDAELSPKILIVSPEQRLSLQTHARRAERWRFLTKGTYYKGTTADDVRFYEAEVGEVVQFRGGDIHRLCGNAAGEDFVIVAEIWQHTDPLNLSNEDDIVRLEDDYAR